MIDWRHFCAQIATSGNGGKGGPSFSPAWNALLHRKRHTGKQFQDAFGVVCEEKHLQRALKLRRTVFLTQLLVGGFQRDDKNGVFFCSPGWPRTHCSAQDGLELVVVNENSWKEAVFAESDWLVRTPALWRGWNWHVAGPEPDSFFLLTGTATPCPPSSELTSSDW